MSPKVNKDLKESKSTAIVSGVVKQDMSNFKSHLLAVASGKDEAKAQKAKETLEMYEGFGRFDKTKSAIVAEWKKNGKKLGPWTNGFQKSHTKSSSTSSESNAGYGTMSSHKFHSSHRFLFVLT